MISVEKDAASTLDIVNHLEELRKRILWALSATVLFSAGAFFFGKSVMAWLTAPVIKHVDELIFISPTEAFVSFLKSSILTGFLFAFPVICYQLWAFLAPAFERAKRARILAWLAGGLLLFYSGVLFSYFLAIPAAVKFLISFGSRIARANISIGRYISFSAALILIGGLVFQIPVIMGLFSDIGLIKTSFLRAKRPYAFFVIMVLAAVITPTQDIMNMLIFAFPMLILYEAGIIIAAFIESRQ